MKQPFKTVIAALLLITVPVVLESCCLTSCGCGDSGGPATFDFVDMTMKLYSRSNFAELPAGTTSLHEISFHVEIEAKYTSMIPTESIGSAAYACSPAPVFSNQQITSIVITSDHDMVASPTTIFKGEDLSILFQVESWNHSGAIADILNKPFAEQLLYFYSDAELDSQQLHTFTFRITLSNGTVFEMVTRELNLTPG